ncbi:3-isopropylmalate dehydratase large subunit [Variovorax dokdonensis]|uniref:3-isopropylmalate dehydratase n=1 Tax=Variovorax dokdonensis TaxID=344883 RepID=A0ABT7NAP5_9BURK|nr:3-isopropylmalate dehydratase large subunit [Variovorax dokdonensis]MDM0045015.1 3-isopropylmalate dehydratase large subunit [Variovorax dokdonensis]
MSESKPRTLFDKIWDAHVVQDLGEGWDLLHIDRHLLHDLSGTAGLRDLAERGMRVRNPELAFSTPDHAVSSAPGRTGDTFAGGARLYHGLKLLSERSGVRLFDLGEPGQGIVHVIGPELGIVQPGMTLICGDSHTCTNGALGAIAFGVGSSELTHALASQTLVLRRPRTLRVVFEGLPGPGVGAKDLALTLIARLGASVGNGFAVEYAGDAVSAMSVEQRMTLCNMSIELGARIGLVAPDQATESYVRGRPYAPDGEQFAKAASWWRTLASDAGAHHDREERIQIADVAPTLTWGISPEHAVSVDGCVPDPAQARDEAQQQAWQVAIDYMGLQAGASLAGTRVDRVFIGSCTNSRLSDLREAASLIRGRSVASHVRAWVVPGSENVKRAAQAEGLDEVFRSAGFEWREPGCSMCVAANGEQASPGERVVSTSNRNFVGRQGPGVRTHLASPASAVAAALFGAIADPRSL